MNKVIYQLTGNELEQMVQMRNQIKMEQDVFFGIAAFIASREKVNLAEVQFNQNTMVFEALDQPPATGPDEKK